MTALPLGPFEVFPARIATLGVAGFTHLINILLDAEAAAAKLGGDQLIATYRTDTADGGVDAGVTSPHETEWIPAGTSAWQFKAGDLKPQACRTELRGATEALELLRSGGVYRLVLGADITYVQIRRREAALRQEAEALGIPDAPGTFKVLNATHLARWIGRYPALTSASLLVGQPGQPMQTFEAWSESNRHLTKWTGSTSRDALLQSIREFAGGTEALDLHVEGPSGVGKTRLVMEALRDPHLAPLVVYFTAWDAAPAGFVQHLLAENRLAVVVVDACGARPHELLAGLLPAGSSIRLITIGEPEGFRAQARVIALNPLEDRPLIELLEANVPGIWPEGARVAAEASGGNIGWALTLARAVVSKPQTSAREMITAETIEQYVTRNLPDGSSFLACSALALFTRVGFDKEVSTEIDVLSAGLNIPAAELRLAAERLADDGLMSREGRYRAISPQPLAVFLAAHGWKVFATSILEGLVPRLDESMMERLFRRAAELGSVDEAEEAVMRLLQPGGDFQSLDVMGGSKKSALLVQFSVVAPQAVTRHLSTLIAQASLDELRGAKLVRRDFVWSLQKLAWHTATFESAADALLRLSIAENEDWSNNATGEWKDLFGLMLPGTAAAPSARMDYLEGVARAASEDERRLAVAGAGRALAHDESIVVSGEVQGGLVVERRGTPRSWEEVWDYQKRAITLLRLLVDDSNATVADEASGALVSSIDPLLESHPDVVAHLASTLGSLSGAALEKARVEVDQLRNLFARAEADTAQRIEALERVEAALPKAAAEETIRVLARTRIWEVGVDVFRTRLASALGNLPVDARAATLMRLVDGESETSFEIGHALAQFTEEHQRIVEHLAKIAERGALPPIAGFLWAAVEDGASGAFDAFLEEQQGSELPENARLALTVRGPKTSAARARALALAREIAPASSAPLLMFWSQELTQAELREVIHDWAQRTATQADYNALMDFCALALHDQTEIEPELANVLLVALEGRKGFPKTGQQTWDWCRVAGITLRHDAERVLGVILDLSRSAGYGALYDSEEMQLLRAAITATGDEGWRRVMEQAESGDWKLSLVLDPWMTEAVPVSSIAAWVDEDPRRAALVARATSVLTDEPSQVVTYLLTTFPDSREVAGGLYGRLITGSWSGHESTRLQGFIDRLTRWTKRRETPGPVRRWATEALASLEQQRAAALEREAEEWG